MDTGYKVEFGLLSQATWVLTLISHYLGTNFEKVFIDFCVICSLTEHLREQNGPLG